MANKAVTLVRLCKTPTGWKRLPVAIGANGRIRPGYALLDGVPVALEGHYAIRTYEGKKTVYRNVGDNAADALAAQQREAHLVTAKAAAQNAGVQVVDTSPKRIVLTKAKDEYVQRQLARGKKRSAQIVDPAITEFIQIVGHTYADQITESSILNFYKHLRKIGNKDRTIHGKHVSIFAWFKWMGLDCKKLAENKPTYTTKEVEVYDPEDLRKLFSSCPEYQRPIYEVLLKTGLRMQEAMHLEWANVDFRSKLLRVREQLDGDSEGVRIKDRAERSVPLPDELIDTLRALRERQPNTVLVLGTQNDTPNWKWLPMLKRAVKKAGLNCGRCSGCKSIQQCSHWKLHKFRATYTTTLLRNGVDVRTVMAWTGHSDLETVLKYLAVADTDPMQKKVSSISWL